MNWQTGRLEQFEIATLNKADLVLFVSPVDQKIFQNLGVNVRSEVVPIGLCLDTYNARPKGLSYDTFNLGFIGTLDWLPNLNGLLWFLREVWPEIQRKHAGKIQLHIAGRMTPKSILGYASDHVVVHGEVPDAVEFIQKLDAMIVPLFAGSGQRVKILEAMALGVPVITTRIGLEGINAENDKELIISDDQELFEVVIDQFINGDIDCNKISKYAKEFIRKHHNQKLLARNVLEILLSE
jgi:glycosyltransferase involved in cell wall biosynthesis